MADRAPDTDSMPWDPARRWLWLTILAVALAVAGFMGARPAYRAYKTRKGLALAKKAQADIEARRWTNAANGVRLALATAPAEPEVWRLAGRFSAALGDPRGLQYWENLVAATNASASDRLEFAEFAMRVGRVDHVARQLSKLLAADTPDPRAWRLAVRHYIAEGRTAEATAAARRWGALEPGSEEAQCALGEALLRDPRETVRKEGQALLLGLAMGEGRQAQTAFAALASSPALGRGEVDVLVRVGERRGDSPAVVTALKLRTAPERRGELLRELVRQAGGTNLSHRRDAVAFLSDQGEVGLALELMPADVVVGDPRLRAARVQALMEAGRWEEAEVELAAGAKDSGFESHLPHLLQAQVEVRRGHRDQAQAHLVQAVDAAPPGSGAARVCAVYAERLGFPRVALSAYRKVAVNPAATIDAGRNVLRLAMALDDAREAQSVLAKVSRQLSGDAGFLVGSVYLDLLLQVPNAAERLPEVERVLALKPGDAFIRATVALGRWRKGDLPAALQVMEEGEVDWDKGVARARAVRVAILAANHQREAARRIARDLDMGALLAEERALVAEWK